MICMSEKRGKIISLSYYTLLHCLVDFCCIYYMVTMLSCRQVGQKV